MIISVQRLLRWIRFFVLFVLLTLLLYQCLDFFSQVFKPDTLYREPMGNDAVKVFANYNEESHHIPMKAFFDRIYLFYWMGE